MKFILPTEIVSNKFYSSMEFVTQQINGIILHHLKIEKQLLMTVCSNFGAKLTHLNFQAGGKNIPVLWELTLPEIKSGAWCKSEILFPFPNRLRDGRYEFEGTTYQFPIDEPINMNAIHGFVNNRPFEVKEMVVKNDKAKISLQHDFLGDFKHYPFAFSLTVSFEYDLNLKSLNTSFDVVNMGDKKMPFGLGWHPYFSFNNELIHKIKMKLPDVDLIEMDERQLPTGNRHPYQIEQIDFAKAYMDHGFHIADLIPKYAISDGFFKLDFEAGDKLEYLQIFNPKNDEGVAIEPMSCNVDAFNNKDGLVALESGETWSSHFAINFSTIEQS
jgi:aldose 1-epimerase